jgi:hypothetical protein
MLQMALEIVWHPLHGEAGCLVDTENWTAGEQALELVGWHEEEDKTGRNIPLEAAGSKACHCGS